jgi:hypothetical protein
VLAALRHLGATRSAQVLSAALTALGGEMLKFPKNVEEYLEAQKDADLDNFDELWGSQGEDEMLMCLEQYFNRHQADFVAWVP